MEVMNNIGIYEWVSSIGWTLFHSIWQVALIGLIIWISFRFISKDNARIRYALSGIGMILICIASAITLYTYIPKGGSDLAIGLDQQLSLINLQQTETSLLSSIWHQLSSYMEGSFPILVNIWLIGMLFLSVNLIIKYINTIRLKKQLSFELRPEYKSIADDLVRKFNLKKKITFKESGIIEIPSLIGYFKPIVFLPISMLSGIPENQLEIIIAHELAHIRRHDYLLQFIQGIIELVFFYHPVVWWLSSVVNAEREHICDDLAVKVCGESLTLIKALNNMEAIRKKQYEMVLAFSGKKGNVLNRAKRILRPKRSINQKRERFMLSGVFTLLFIGLFLVSNYAISGNLAYQKNSSKINIVESENSGPFVKTSSLENDKDSSQEKKQRKEKKKKEQKLLLVDEPETVTEVEVVQEIDLVKERSLVKEIELEEEEELSEVKEREYRIRTEMAFPKDSTKSKKWVKKKADEMIKEQLKDLEDHEMDIEDMKMDLNVDEMKRELKEALEDLDVDFEKELKEHQIEIEEHLKELSDEDYLKDLEKEQLESQKELKTTLKEIQKNDELTKVQKEKIQASIKKSLEKLNSPEFKENLRLQIEKAKKSLEKTKAEFNSGKMQLKLKEQRETIKKELKKMESPEFKEKIERQIREGKQRLQEHKERLKSAEYRKELEESIKNNSNDEWNSDSPEPVTRVFHGDHTTPSKNIKVGYRIPLQTSFRFSDSDGKNPLIVFDGKRISRDEMENIKPDEIGRMNVIKGESAIQKYGENAENGVIEISSKYSTFDSKQKHFRVNSSDKVPLYVLDGKEITLKKFKNTNPDNCKSVNVIKGDAATEKYGKKAKNGVIEITSKSNKSQTATKIKFGTSKNPPLFILDGKKLSQKEVEKLDKNSIESISVLKDKSAIKKYGKKAKNGVVIITSKSDNSTKTSAIKIKSSSGKNSPLYIVEGKKVSINKIGSITSDEIESIVVVKDEKALDEYGKDGKNGVVVIQLKK